MEFRGFRVRVKFTISVRVRVTISVKISTRERVSARGRVSVTLRLLFFELHRRWDLGVIVRVGLGLGLDWI
jgi:hypothetical protein